ncbi:MAG: hypothetical protein KGJ02_05795 [Verrucomicrobiota bacterium]|nr:hypothetical protein [Verrucomicrobiota bacterium]
MTVNPIRGNPISEKDVITTTTVFVSGKPKIGRGAKKDWTAQLEHALEKGDLEEVEEALQKGGSITKLFKEKKVALCTINDNEQSGGYRIKDGVIVIQRVMGNEKEYKVLVVKPSNVVVKPSKESDETEAPSLTLVETTVKVSRVAKWTSNRIKQDWTEKLKTSLYEADLGGVEEALRNGANVEQIIKSLHEFEFPVKKGEKRALHGYRVGRGRLAIQKIELIEKGTRKDAYTVVVLNPDQAKEWKNIGEKNSLLLP